MNKSITSITKLIDKRGAVLFLSLIAVLFSSGYGQKNLENAGEIRYKNDLTKLSGKEVIADEEIVSMSRRVHIDRPISQSKIKAPASIFFVIDNSGSMSHSGDNNDVEGLRYSVTSELIDTINQIFDSSSCEIGFAVFSQHLFFLPDADPRLTTLPAPYDSGSYFPVLNLNTSFTPDGLTGYQILKKWLQTKEYTKNGITYMDLEYQPNPSWLASTHINTGFEAAKAALNDNNAKNPRSRRFIIFLSDGDATYPQYPTSLKWEFVKGTDVPTTFTVFFDNSSNPKPHSNLVKMTNNIKANGFSSSNPKSNIWAIQTANIKQLLVDSVLSVIVTTMESKPDSIEINGKKDKDYDEKAEEFVFDQIFALTGEKTGFDFKVDYTIIKDSITPDGETLSVQDDSTVSGKFDVKIKNGAQIADTFDVKLWKRGIAFFFDGKEIGSASPIMKELEMRFKYNPGSANFEYTKVNVEVRSKHTGDREDLQLAKSGSYFFKKITHASTNSTNQTSNNGILETFITDTLIAVFRNEGNAKSPKLPLDTVKIEIPLYTGGPVIVTKAAYFDTKMGDKIGADGYIDSIHLTLDNSSAISDNSVKEVVDAIVFPEKRGFTIKDFGAAKDKNGIWIRVKENTGHLPMTAVHDFDKLEIKDTLLLSQGSLLIPDDNIEIHDKVAPVINSGYADVYQLDTIPDSLVVVFSEKVSPIDGNGIEPFYFFYTAKKVDYLARLTGLGKLHDSVRVFRIDTTYSHDGTIISSIKDKDSIWINFNERKVSDIEGNTQEANNIRRELVSEFHPSLFEVKIKTTKPFIITNDHKNLKEIIKKLKLKINKINNKEIVTVIQIKPVDNDLDKIGNYDSLSALLSIVDPVGNILVSDEKMLINYYIDESGNKKFFLLWVWDGHNLAGRVVADGAYWGVADVTFWRKESDGNTYETKKQKMSAGYIMWTKNPESQRIDE